MPRTGWTPSFVPYGADQTVYLVIDRIGGLGTVYRETEVERTDLETIITDLLSGQFNDPARVVAFNTLEHWSEDVSEYVAFEIQSRCDIEGTAVPDHIQDFVASYTDPARQLALRLV
jgi:dGTP triphosphohydrolase